MAVYPHMLIIRPHAALRLPALNFTFGWVADSSDFGLLGSNVPQNGRFPAQDAPEPPEKFDAELYPRRRNP